jgi:thioester reductase-like protein
MPRPGYDDVVLVTGFPAFHARRMVHELLASEPRTFVYLVVLAKFLPQAEAELEVLPFEQRVRVAVLEGDAAAIDFGLSGAEIRQLGREVDILHHMAHASFVGVDRKAAEVLNVLGAAEAVEVARTLGELRCLVLHSTAFVAGDRTGVVLEDDLDRGQAFRNVVEETRLRGETIVRRAMGELPIAVVRPTNVVGDSGTGEIGRFDGPYLLFLLIVASPADFPILLPGRGDAPLALVPVDFVVRAARHIGRSRAAVGKTFHLADPSPLSSRRVFDLVARAAGRQVAKGHIPGNVMRMVMRAPGVERLLSSPRSLIDQLTSSVRFDTRNADAVLAGTNIVCPPFESYVEQLVARVEERVRKLKERRVEEVIDVGEDPLP